MLEKTFSEAPSLNLGYPIYTRSQCCFMPNEPFWRAGTARLV